jgi:O-antigen/teichoic acid export membrane protein
VYAPRFVLVYTSCQLDLTLFCGALVTSGIVRIVQNSTLSFIADATARASNTVLFILISRRLGATEGGIYALALTYSLLFTQLSFWGMDQLLTREVAKDRAVAGKFVGNLVIIRGIVSLTLFLVMTVLVKNVMGYAPRTSMVIVIVGLSIVTESISNICQALYFAFEQVRYSTMVGIVVGIFRLGGGGLALLAGGRVEAIAVVLFVSSLAGLALNLTITYRRFPAPVWRLDVGFWLSQLRTIVPFVLVSIFYIIEFQGDTLLLSMLKSERDIGIYNAATTVLFALALAPQAFRVAIFPVMSRLYKAASPALVTVYEKSFKYLLVVSLPVSAALTLSADTIVRLLFRSGFEESAAVLRVVIWTFVLLMINVPSARLMIVANAQGMLALFQASSMVLNLGLNLVLIPGMGATGAAWARIGSTSLSVMLGAAYTWWKLYRWNPFRIIALPLVSLFAMMMLGWLLSGLGLNDIAAACGGLISYAALVWGFGVISHDERAFLAQLYHQGVTRL